MVFSEMLYQKIGKMRSKDWKEFFMLIIEEFELMMILGLLGVITLAILSMKLGKNFKTIWMIGRAKFECLPLPMKWNCFGHSELLLYLVFKELYYGTKSEDGDQKNHLPSKRSSQKIVQDVEVG